ncbi:MAG: sulfite exporter TauE/SafE family protein, partial [Verrucomicrobiales bacterium]
WQATLAESNSGMPSAAEWIVLLSGLLAGAINAIAGGGTMLTFPALLAAGLPPVLANTTSTIALYFGMPGSVWAFRERLKEVRAWLLPLGLVSLLGGSLGAVMLLRLPESIFETTVPWLILFATLLFLLNEPMKRWAGQHGRHDEPERPNPVAIAFQTGVGIYSGYFGAGIGIMMLAGFSLLGLRDVHRMNALKNLLGLLCNTAATVLFLASGKFDLRLTLILLIGSIPGYYLGSLVSQKIPAKVVRSIVGLVGVTIAIQLLSKQWAN